MVVCQAQNLGPFDQVHEIEKIRTPQKAQHGKLKMLQAQFD
jgi:hypothetical protein